MGTSTSNEAPDQICKSNMCVYVFNNDKDVKYIITKHSIQCTLLAESFLLKVIKKTKIFKILYKFYKFVNKPQ